MNKLLWSIVPACITFGPLFMTRIGGTAGADRGDSLVFVGVFMLMAGLIIMFKAIATQQKLIEKLRAEPRVEKGAEVD